MPYDIAHPPFKHHVSSERPPTVNESILQGIRLSKQQVPHGVYGGPFEHQHRNIKKQHLLFLILPYTHSFMDFTPNSILRQIISKEFMSLEHKAFRDTYFNTFSKSELALIKHIYYQDLAKQQKIIWF